MSTKKKLIVAVVCLLVATCSLVTGTLAWLTTKTESVVNTFTTSDINITLTETAAEFKMVPGGDIAKDPVVTVEANSEACYLFVKIEENLGSWDTLKTDDTFQTYLTYEVITGTDGWTALLGVAGVYYRLVDATTQDTPFNVIAENKVTVNGENVTKEMMETLNADDATLPTLTFTAYAVQQHGFADAAAAWAEAAKLDTPNP